jgi:hypothetical protein
MRGQQASLSERSSAARSFVATLEIVGFGGQAHHLAGGGLPSSEHLVALLALVAATSHLLRRQVLSVGVAVGAAVVGQLLIHVVFTLSAPHAAHAAPGLLPSADMLLAHTIGAAATVVALAWQEQAIVRLVGFLLPPIQSAGPSATATDVPESGAPRPHRGLEVVNLTPRRGPPRLAAAAS